MKISIISAIAAATTLASVTSPLAQEYKPTGQDTVNNIMSKEGVKSCFESALRAAINEPHADLKWRENLNSDGDYRYVLNASAFKDSGSILKSFTIVAQAGFSTKGSNVMLLVSSVEASGLRKDVGALSTLGLTYTFEGSESKKLGDQTEKVNATLQENIHKCAYKQDIKYGKTERKTIKYKR